MLKLRKGIGGVIGMEEVGILVGVNTDNKGELDFDYSMEELKQLSDACGIEVAGKITQNLKAIHKGTYVGKGKIEEIRAEIELLEATVLIANDELSPSQIRNLGKALDIRVIDRSMVILEIFSYGAKTKEAKLQVEVAQLQYMLPRLIGSRLYLSRQGGGSTLRNRGAGETKLELDRRQIEKKIVLLNKRLGTLVTERKVQRQRRKKQQLPIVSLVGYTNAGKSTIMNRIIESFGIQEEDKKVLEKDALFATLETSVRQITLADKKSFLLTDTVGFVDKLPHHLVKAFRSTLEEVIEADLLIHVVDASYAHMDSLIKVTEKTLEAIGVGDIPILYAYNKSDRLDMFIPKITKDGIYLSAKENIGIDELIEGIKTHLYKDYRICEFLIPYSEGQIEAYFNAETTVLLTEYQKEGILMKVECQTKDYKRYVKYAL